MQLIRFSRAAYLPVACAILAACGESTAPKEAVITVDSLLADISDAQAFSAAGMSMSGAPMVAGMMPTAATCPYDSATQSFVCPTTTMNGVTMSMYYQLFDASGALQSAFNPTTTAAIRTVSDLSGTVPTTGALTATIEGHNDKTLSGLLTATRTLNGSSTTTVTMNDGSQPLRLTIAETTTDLVLPQRGSATPYPLSGSISMDVTTSGGGFDVHVTITFNGTSTATMVVTSNGTTQTCTVNMASPQATPSCS